MFQNLCLLDFKLPEAVGSYISALTKNCYLYKQRKISNEERVKNLNILVGRPDKRSTATVDDLRAVYMKNECVTRNSNNTSEETMLDPSCAENQTNTSELQEMPADMSALITHGPWPPQIYEHIAVKTKEGWSVGEVLSVDDDQLSLRLFKKVCQTGYENYSLWQDVDDERTVHRDCVLPIRPQTELVTPLCMLSRTRRWIVIQVGNPDLSNRC